MLNTGPNEMAETATVWVLSGFADVMRCEISSYADRSSCGCGWGPRRSASKFWQTSSRPSEEQRRCGVGCFSAAGSNDTDG
jgi:hypothetical protein